MTPPSRLSLQSPRRLLLKAGTSTVTSSTGYPSLARLGAIVEQVAELHRRGVQVIIVSSGATGMGKRLMRHKGRMSMSLSQAALSGSPSNGSSEDHFMSMLQSNERPHAMANAKKTYDSACAAAGQFEMMNMYHSLFSQMDISSAQVLLTQGDFADEGHLNNLRYSIERLLSVGIIPIVNENDAVSANRGYTEGDLFSDNDSLAALCGELYVVVLRIIIHLFSLTYLEQPEVLDVTYASY
jgi:delta-1-pyrroline-5-carboxylate synthetase